MCFKCHGCISEKDALDALKDVNRSEFHLWNSTSIGHMLILLSGANGEKVHNLTKNIMTEYLKWYKEKPNRILQSKNLEFIINDTEKFYQENVGKCNDEIFTKYQTRISLKITNLAIYNSTNSILYIYCIK